MLSANDQKFLNNFITAIDTVSSALPKQIIAIKNLKSLHIYCTKYFLEEILCQSASEISGKLLLTADSGRFSPKEQILQEDSYVINKRKTLTYLKLNDFNHGIKPRVFIKSPIINHETNNVVGIIYQAYDWSLINFKNQLIKAHQLVKPSLNKTEDLPKLTKREKQIIFFFLAKLNSQEIADILHTIEDKPISKSTIDTIIINRLYTKFEVKNRQALYEKLLNLGYDNHIPKELLISTTIPVDEAQFY